MSKGICNNNERRIDIPEQVRLYSIEDLIGKKAYIRSGTMHNIKGLEKKTVTGVISFKDGKKTQENSVQKGFTISAISFRISVDGKTITLISFEEITDRYFTLKDIEIVV